MECLHSVPGHTRLSQAQIRHLNVFSFVTEDTGRVIGKIQKSRDFPGQWLRICLPMQGTCVQSLVRGGDKAMGQLSPCNTSTEPTLCRVQELQLLKPVCPRACSPQEKPPQWEAHALQLEGNTCSSLEKTHTQQRRPSQAKNINNFLKNLVRSAN